jgi:hypothetical protein
VSDSARPRRVSGDPHRAATSHVSIRADRPAGGEHMLTVVQVLAGIVAIDELVELDVGTGNRAGAAGY